MLAFSLQRLSSEARSVPTTLAPHVAYGEQVRADAPVASTSQGACATVGASAALCAAILAARLQSPLGKKCRTARLRWHGRINRDRVLFAPRAAGGEHATSLPAPWQAAEDQDGHVYYWNTETGETSWDMPGQSTAGADEWEVLESDDHPGHPYYHNKVTGKTTWDMPAELQGSDSQQDAVDDEVDLAQGAAIAETQSAPSAVKKQKVKKFAAAPEAIEQPAVVDEVDSADCAAVAETQSAPSKGKRQKAKKDAAAPEAIEQSAIVDEADSTEGAPIAGTKSAPSKSKKQKSEKDASAAEDIEQPAVVDEASSADEAVGVDDGAALSSATSAKPKAKTKAKKKAKATSKKTQVSPLSEVDAFLQKDLLLSAEECRAAVDANKALSTGKAEALAETFQWLQEELQPGAAPWRVATLHDPELVTTPVAVLEPALEWLEEFLWNQNWAVGFGRQAIADAIIHRPRLLYQGVVGYEATLEWLERHGVSDSVINTAVDKDCAVPYPHENYPWFDLFALGVDGLEAGALWTEEELGLSRDEVAKELQLDPYFILTAVTAAGSSSGPPIPGFPLPAPRDTFLSEQAARSKDLFQTVREAEAADV